MVTGRLSRAIVVARRGMVATGHPLASAAGLRILTAGGNAVDAAVAIAGVLGVAQPMMSGLGADTFMLVYRASERKLYAVNGSGVAPYAATTGDRKSTRLNSSHANISYAVFCLKKKKKEPKHPVTSSP